MTRQNVPPTPDPDGDYDCPHCHAHNPVGPHGYHVCPDNRPWTQPEKDAWREYVRRVTPGVTFTPTFHSEFMGRHNRRAA